MDTKTIRYRNRMTKKIHIPREYESETIFRERYGRDGLDSLSISISAEYIWYHPKKIDICHNDCSDFCMENYGDYDIERTIHIREEAALKLASKLHAKDAATLVRNFADRFRPYGYDAMKKITEWLELKGIEYSVTVY